MQRLLVQGRASPADPEFLHVTIVEDSKVIPFHDFFHRAGIGTLEKDLVISCHGNTTLDTNYAHQIQQLKVDGHQVGSIQTGGLYFAKPSLEAANMPDVPVVSVPLDEISFLAPHVPSGVAAIGGVGISKYGTAAKFMRAVLSNDYSGVFVHNANEKLLKGLEKLKISVLGVAGRDNRRGEGLVVGRLGNLAAEFETFDKLGAAGIYTADLPSLDAFSQAKASLMNQSVFARGEENVAYFAAKCLSRIINPKVHSQLEEAAMKKASSYENRTIGLDSFRGGLR